MRASTHEETLRPPGMAHSSRDCRVGKPLSGFAAYKAYEKAYEEVVAVQIDRGIAVSENPFQDCWFLTGPTAAGKTAVGVALAERLGADIVSMDSMAVYRGMDIGTAKPTPDERQRVAHHLIDLVEPHESFSLARYLDGARECVLEIRARQREVLFVGGTPLYLKGLLRGIFSGPPADEAFRRRMDELARREGPEALHRRLVQVDPPTAQRLHPNDTRRIIRALEVFEQTGRPISHYQQQFARGLPAEACRVFVLDWPGEQLRWRIEARVDSMFRRGLVDEVRRLLALQRPMSRTARQALGYREVIEHLQGERSLAQTVELVKLHTWRFSRRQRTWFRSLSECRFVRPEAPFDPLRVAEEIAHAGRTVAPTPFPPASGHLE